MAVQGVDLHRHLEGAIRVETMLDLGRAEGIYPEGMELEDLRESVVVKDAMPLFEVLSRFDLLRRPIKRLEAIQRISREFVEDAFLEGIAWLNLRFSPSTLAAAAGVSMLDTFQAVVQGAEEAAAWLLKNKQVSMQIEILAIISRGRGVAAAWDVVRALDEGAKGLIHGVDFASDEIRHRTSEFQDVAERIARMDLPLTIHTGEGVPASHIAEALALKGVQRLSHALSLLDDPALVARVKQLGLLVEVSPSSNLRTSLVASPDQHPVLRMIDEGLPIAICTDDPVLFAIDLPSELRLVETQMGVSSAALEAMQAHAQRYFFR